MFEDNRKNGLGTEAAQSTVGKAAVWLGWLLLAVLTIVTAVHAITLVEYQTSLRPTGANIFDAIRVGGVVLVELFAATTAVLLVSHQLRAGQKPAALVIEGTWVLFAAMNLFSSFAVEHGRELPQLVGMWLAYGLPISALLIGIEFYIMVRLNPDTRRADEERELSELLVEQQHRASVEVLTSPQMAAVMRQAAWQRLPQVIGQQYALSDEQIAALVHQAPKLLGHPATERAAVEGHPAVAGDPAKAAAEISLNGHEGASGDRPLS